MSTTEIDHEYTNEIVCPHCGSELSDSWEMGDKGERTCDDCGKDYDWYRDVEVTYVSMKK